MIHNLICKKTLLPDYGTFCFESPLQISPGRRPIVAAPKIRATGGSIARYTEFLQVLRELIVLFLNRCFLLRNFVTFGL